MTNFLPVAIAVLLLWGGTLSIDNTSYHQLVEDATYISSQAHMRNQQYESLLQDISAPENSIQNQPPAIDTIETTPSFYTSLSQVLQRKADEYLLLYQTTGSIEKQKAISKLENLKTQLLAVISPSDTSLTEVGVSQNYVELQQLDSWTSITDSQMYQEISNTLSYIDQIIEQINSI